MGAYGNKGSEFESKAAMDLHGGGKGKLLADPTDEARKEELLKQDLQQQKEIEEYNLALQYAADDTRFTNKTFVGNTMIIKLERFHWLVPSKLNPDLFTVNSQQFVAVTTPDFPQGKVVINPLPYNYRGVVIALGDEVIKYRKENGLTEIVPGDIVELGWFDIKENRYYPEKHKIDLITLDNPYAPNYEGFVKVPAQFIEAIVKEDHFEAVYGQTREEYYKQGADKEKIDYEAAGNEIQINKL